MPDIYTIGHSNHAPETFLALLEGHGINAVADVRTAPYSRYTPQFNKNALPPLLKKIGAVYVFMGNYLGARPDEPACYRNGRVDFARLALTDAFQEGLERVRTGAERYKLALMCSEKDPITCHRTILVCRHLRAEDTVIRHIREDGALEAHGDAEARLLTALGMDFADLFKTPEEMLEDAYDRQGERIAHREEEEDEDAGNA